MRKAAAPSPKARSNAERGAATRQSLAMTRTFRAEPALTESTAARSAVVPARSESAKSAVTTSRRRSSALATRLAPCFSLKAYDVEAKSTPSTVARSMPSRQFVAAATAMVTLSSSKFATERSPLPPPALRPPAPIAPNGKRNIGTYAPYEVIPTI